MPAGRPTIYTDELAKEICKRISEGESLRSICQGPVRFDPMTDIDRHSHMPDMSTVLDWALDLDHEFSQRYEKARQNQMEYYADILRESADEPEVARARLRSDNTKWLMSKMAPRRFGDRIQTEVTGKDGESLDVGSANQLASVMAAAFAKAVNTEDDDT